MNNYFVGDVFEGFRMEKYFRLAFIISVAAYSVLFADEKYFQAAKVVIRLSHDSVQVQVVARAEDLMNTVHVFPGSNSDKEPYRLYEKRIETYFQTRIPLLVDGKRVDLRVVQWKPGGRGIGDGFDSASLNTIDHAITLGGRLPKNPDHLEVRADLWVERTDADTTIVEFSLVQDGLTLRRRLSRTERTLKFPISSDSLAAMRRHLPSQQDESFPYLDENAPD